MQHSSSDAPKQSHDAGDPDRVDAWSDGDAEADFKPLTAEQAVQWRQRQAKVSVWELVGWQVLLGVLASLLGWLLTQRLSVMWSVAYGAASVALPSAVMAYGLTSSALARLLAGVAQAALVGFMFWEGVKVLLVVLMLWVAPRVVPDLSWLGLLAGLVLVLKVHWLGWWIRSRRGQQTR
jgi:ATP synthase protein I